MNELSLHVCANLAREASEALRARGHAGVRVVAYKPACDARPVAPPVLAPGPGDVVVGGPCVDEVAPTATAAQRLTGQTCFHLLAEPARVDALLRQGAFLVTAGWLARWREWLAGGGFDQHSARLLFGESARRVVLLDTGVDPGAPEALAAFAGYVGLPAEREEVGLERLGLVLGEVALRRRAERAEQRLADYAVALDTLSTLAPTASEPALAEAITSLARVLCGAARTAFWPAPAGQLPGLPLHPGPPVVSPAGAACEATPEDEARALAASGQGFVVAFGPPGGESGWLAVADLRLPAHLEHYRHLAEMLAQAGHLAIQSARQLRGLLPICFGCKKIRDDAGLWSRIEEYIAAHSGATFTHGLCPECLDALYPPDGGGPGGG